MPSIGSGGEEDRDRLRCIAASADSPTLTTLRGLLPEGDFSLLDVGCGTGSVAMEMARLPGAHVYVVDQDTSLLPATRPENLRVIEADVAAWEPAASFDVIHARFVLSHITSRDRVLASLMSWVKPGGAVVVTEPYHLPYGADPSVDRVLSAYRELVEAEGMSFSFARRVAGLMAAIGAASVEVSSRTTRLGGGSSVDRWRPMIKRVEDRLVVSPRDLESFYAFAASPIAFDIPQIILTVVGRTPKAEG